MSCSRTSSLCLTDFWTPAMTSPFAACPKPSRLYCAFEHPLTSEDSPGRVLKSRFVAEHSRLFFVTRKCFESTKSIKWIRGLLLQASSSLGTPSPSSSWSWCSAEANNIHSSSSTNSSVLQHHQPPSATSASKLQSGTPPHHLYSHPHQSHWENLTWQDPNMVFNASNWTPKQSAFTTNLKRKSQRLHLLDVGKKDMHCGHLQALISSRNIKWCGLPGHDQKVRISGHPGTKLYCLGEKGHLSILSSMPSLSLSWSSTPSSSHISWNKARVFQYYHTLSLWPPFPSNSLVLSWSYTNIFI